MGVRKNHTNDALSELHELVDGFPSDVEQRLMETDDGEIHSKKEAREEISTYVAEMIKTLREFEQRMQLKYK